MPPGNPAPFDRKPVCGALARQVDQVPLWKPFSEFSRVIFYIRIKSNEFEMSVMNSPTLKSKLFSIRAITLFVILTAFFLIVTSGGSRAGAQQQEPSDPRPRRVGPQKNGPPILPTPTPTPGTTPSPSKDDSLSVDPDEIVKVDTSNVILNVRVIDRNNRPINDVRPEEFHVFENGVPQPVLGVSKEEVPISYGLAVDSSGSLRSQMPTVIDAAKTIINSNKPGDETFLLRFVDSEKIETLQEFTANKEDLMDAVDRIYTEGGQTAIIDALYLASEHVAH
jgi:Ca-activated chloride channel family protein